MRFQNFSGPWSGDFLVHGGAICHQEFVKWLPHHDPISPRTASGSLSSARPGCEYTSMGDEYECTEIARMQGFLEKKSRLRVLSYWRKYWFVLEGKTLLCFKNQEESDNFFKKRNSRKAFLSFANVHAVRPVCSNNPARHAFEIITRGPKIYLSATDDPTRQSWLDALKQALQLPCVSPPLRKKPASVSGMSLLRSEVHQELSISQPDLRRSDPEHEFRPTFRVVLDPCNAAADEPEVVLRGNHRNLAPPRPPSKVQWRNTAVEFFMGEGSDNWPGLSLELYDEVLDEIMQQRKDARLDAELRDMDTQTDFPDLSEDEQTAYLMQVRQMRNELITYLSTASLNIMEDKPIPVRERFYSDTTECWRRSDLRSKLFTSLSEGAVGGHASVLEVAMRKKCNVANIDKEGEHTEHR